MIALLEEWEVLLNCHLTVGIRPVGPICQWERPWHVLGQTIPDIPYLLRVLAPLLRLPFPFLPSSLLLLTLDAHQHSGFSSFSLCKAFLSNLRCSQASPYTLTTYSFLFVLSFPGLYTYSQKPIKYHGYQPRHLRCIKCTRLNYLSIQPSPFH